MEEWISPWGRESTRVNYCFALKQITRSFPDDLPTRLFSPPSKLRGESEKLRSKSCQLSMGYPLWYGVASRSLLSSFLLNDFIPACVHVITLILKTIHPRFSLSPWFQKAASVEKLWDVTNREWGVWVGVVTTQIRVFQNNKTPSQRCKIRHKAASRRFPVFGTWLGDASTSCANRDYKRYSTRSYIACLARNMGTNNPITSTMATTGGFLLFSAFFVLGKHHSNLVSNSSIPLESIHSPPHYLQINYFQKTPKSPLTTSQSANLHLIYTTHFLKIIRNTLQGSADNLTLWPPGNSFRNTQIPFRS